MTVPHRQALRTYSVMYRLRLRLAAALISTAVVVGTSSGGSAGLTEQAVALRLGISSPGSDGVLKELHKTIKKVTEDTDELRFNTAIASMMELTNFLYKEDTVPREVVRDFSRLLAPYAPHFAEELWSRLGNTQSVIDAGWPAWDPARLVEDTVEVAVQVMGKVRGTISVAPDADQATAEAAARAVESVQNHLEGKTVRRVIWVPGKILNFVVG